MNKNIIISLFIVFMMFLITSCNWFNHSKELTKTKVLGHRANGVRGYNDTLMDNTLNSIIKAIEITDGIELDIQLSQDETIWLFHDEHIITSNSDTINIPMLTNKEIIKHLNNLYPGEKFNTLEDIFKYFHKNNINKTISLDVKAFWNEKCFENSDEFKNYMNRLSTKIINLANSYKVENNLMVESDSKYFLTLIRKQSNIKTFFLGFSDFREHIKIARENKFSGLSHIFSDSEVNPENIGFAKRKGIEVQLWTPNSPKDLEYVLSLNPNYIQTDNTSYFVKNRSEKND